MENNLDIHEELREVAPSLEPLATKGVYTFPVGYFEHLAETILQKVKTGAEPVYHFVQENNYSVPTGYFDNLSASIMGKIKNVEPGNNEIGTELAEVAPLLNTINKANLYTIPVGYFDTLKVETPLKQTAKVISFKASKVFSYAVAAVITAILAIGLFLVFDKPAQTVEVASKNTKVEVQKLGEEDIIEFLSGAAAEDLTSAKDRKKPHSEIVNSVKEMSDEEIKQFLQDHGEHESI